MLVFGDPSREVGLKEMVRKLSESLADIEASTPGSEVHLLDAVRKLLITSGELEQGIADASEDSRALEMAVAATDAAAGALAGHFESAAGNGPIIATALRPVLEGLSTLEDISLCIKVPEGFAFYSLFPEQYVEAARQWLWDNPPRQQARALVVGVRSIGTTLSAVVAACLKLAGWDVRRLTVRPKGHPFDRTVHIPRDLVAGADRVLIVDEGPGLSGSSMACCARAVCDLGFSEEWISFFPGHDRMPGGAASPEVRHWWEATRRYVVPSAALRWNGRSLVQSLAEASMVLRNAPIVRTEDLSGGLWRKIVFRDESQWPAVCGIFERAKYRVVLQDGSSILWKFAGLGDSSNPAHAPVLGFVPSRWIDGQPLTPGDPDDELLIQMGRHIRAVATPPLAPAERTLACERLRRVVCTNVKESLGDDAATRAREMLDRVTPSIESLDLVGYGDGRLEPHEWLRCGDGSVIKVDCGGHDADHTIVGPQPAAWDLAGAAVEWKLDRAQTALLVEGFGATLDRAVMDFYELAYAAFRAGQCSMCADLSAADPAERGRLEGAAQQYRARMRALLKT